MSNQTDSNKPDGLMDDQGMPTADGEMASGGSEEVVPPRRGDADRTPNGDD